MMKSQWNHNSEGYIDKTAGMAIQNITREERKKRMAKKRNCRRSKIRPEKVTSGFDA